MTAALNQRLVRDSPCKCGFVLYHPIAQSDTSKIGLYSDSRFPGRCILALRSDRCFQGGKHVELLEELPDSMMLDFMSDVRAVCRAIGRAVAADRVNIAILGNREHHLHAHLIPRFSSNEAFPDCSPWDDPRPKTPLSEERAGEITRSIYNQLVVPGADDAENSIESSGDDSIDDSAGDSREDMIVTNNVDDGALVSAPVGALGSLASEEPSEYHRRALGLYRENDELLDKLVSIREARGLTQEELADRMNVPPESVARIESGGLPLTSLLTNYALEVGASVHYDVRPVECSVAASSQDDSIADNMTTGVVTTDTVDGGVVDK